MELLRFAQNTCIMQCRINSCSYILNYMKKFRFPLVPLHSKYKRTTTHRGCCDVSLLPGRAVDVLEIDVRAGMLKHILSGLGGAVVGAAVYSMRENLPPTARIWRTRTRSSQGEQRFRHCTRIILEQRRRRCLRSSCTARKTLREHERRIRATTRFRAFCSRSGTV